MHQTGTASNSIAASLL